MVTHMESLMAHGNILVPLVASRVTDLAQTGSQHIAYGYIRKSTSSACGLTKPVGVRSCRLAVTLSGRLH